MTEAPNPPAPAPPKRKRWWRVQLSLASCVAMMLAAALLLGLNMSPRKEHITDLVVLPVYGFPILFGNGEIYVLGYDGNYDDWAKSKSPPIPKGEGEIPEFFRRAGNPVEAPPARGFEFLFAWNRESELRSSWRLPANIAANAAMILAVGYAVESFRRRRERHERQG